MQIDFPLNSPLPSSSNLLNNWRTLSAFYGLTGPVHSPTHRGRTRSAAIVDVVLSES